MGAMYEFWSLKLETGILRCEDALGKAHTPQRGERCLTRTAIDDSPAWSKKSRKVSDQRTKTLYMELSLSMCGSQNQGIRSRPLMERKARELEAREAKG